MPARSGRPNGAGKHPVYVEVSPADELRPATPANTDRAERTADGRFAPGNAVARSQRLRPGALGGARIDTTLPEYRPFARWGQRYAAHRRRELAAAHGGEISAGVGAIVESAALAMAASRFMTFLGSQSGDADQLAKAARLSETARQHELAAWELASRECQVRAKRSPKDIHEAVVAAFGFKDGAP